MAKERSRITREVEQEMVRLRGQRKSIKDIAQTLGVHRQTVRTHLRERKDVLLADEAKKQVLVEALREHFRDLHDFATKGLRQRLKPSISARERAKQWVPMGTLEVPADDRLVAVLEEWERMHEWSHRDERLLRALKRHTPESALWVQWDKRQELVADYESASYEFREWLNEGAKSYRGIGPQALYRVQKFFFGCALIRTSGASFGKADVTYDSLWIKGGEPRLILGQNFVEIKGATSVGSWVVEILAAPFNRPEWRRLKEATEKLKGEERQSELGDIHKKIESAIEDLELIHAFRGHCDLCPI